MSGVQYLLCRAASANRHTSPLKAADFIVGYMLPIIPIAIAQCAICYLMAIILGLSVTANILHAILMIIPFAIFQIALGLLCGSVLNVKQVGGVCGALLTNLTAWLSGVWFDLELVGGSFRKIANMLPYVHAVELERAMINGDYSELLPHVCVVIGYTIVITIGAILVFLRQMKKQ
ncbi:MAG: ABC transporter permease [Ruminococcaceae bacterium]|nr:ABC transporter permease [Oscillospiraceae bacterium]